MPIEHRAPTESTVKELYGNAFRCAKPDCMKPLYRLSDETGDRILNSRISHIHARREGGPRWDASMDEASNRSAANLVLLCIEHSYEIDEPGADVTYDADTLRSWKQAQIDEHDTMQREWALSEAEAAEAIRASLEPSIGPHILLATARAASTLRVTAVGSRRGPSAQAALWRRTKQRYRSSLLAWDPETGERLYADPPLVETREHRLSLQVALAEAAATTEAAADLLHVELASASALDATAAPWCDWVARSAQAVVAASGRWPDNHDVEDDYFLNRTVQDLDTAVAALLGHLRGEQLDLPPEAAPPEDPQPSESETARAVQRALVESAARFRRVDHLPYDRDLAEQLRMVTYLVSGLPELISTAGLGLKATAIAAASVARNSDDEALAEVLEDCAVREPVTAAAMLLWAHWQVCREADRAALAEAAEEMLRSLVDSVNWADRGFWEANEAHAGWLAGLASHLLGTEIVWRRLSDAVATGPDVLRALVFCGAGWTESLPTPEEAEQRVISRNYRDLPPWFPAVAVVAALEATNPEVTPTSNRATFGDADEFEVLAGQVLALAKAAE